ncbi:MAG TPA: type 1 glutamine amidotransferase domain-containing protein, partial [Miltoncostaeaceae bacterium]|nr:type 1 glutamine amidotransferase domain-containing protein [Miltoncostaeaceae bacterium]
MGSGRRRSPPRDRDTRSRPSRPGYTRGPDTRGGGAQPGRLDGETIAFLATDAVEQVELTEPWKAVEDEGATPVLLSIADDSIRGFDPLDPADSFPVDRGVAGARAEDFDGLVLPGGVANPDRLRTDEDVRRFVREFFEQGKPVGVICHGPWTLIDAGVADGRTMTSWPSLKTDLANAGVTWVDEEVVTDMGLVTSRKPDDLPAFCAKIVEEFAEGRH